ncbi:hypothetical protein [Tsukamurella pseudospumae]|uniref:hypothetical protein n=1 Tax=Tsukamurella pseudospumae TaxID=239498 RepID=UPI000AEC9E6D|nr:hypothetical protein [Tsukamurella pseudospumae]
MNKHRTTAAGSAEPAPAAPPLVLHPRSGVVIVVLLVLTLGLMIVPLIVSMLGAPVG